MRRLFTLFSCFFLCLVLLTGIGLPAAAERPKRYQSYVCLGDSISAGYSDLTHGLMGIHPEGQKGAFHTLVADEVAENLAVYALAGATTNDVLYLLEDGYPVEKTRYARFEDPSILPVVRASVSKADLITVNAASNDLLVAPLHRFLEYLDAGELFTSVQTGTIREDLESGNLNDALLGILNSLADQDKLFTLLPTLASYIQTGIQDYLANWPYIISDIHELNQSKADLLVLGVYNPLASYDTMEGDDQIHAALAYLCDTLTPIVELINMNLRLGAKGGGYTYVSILGIDVDMVHPSAKGHAEIAERILNALSPSSAPAVIYHPFLKRLKGILGF